MGTPLSITIIPPALFLGVSLGLVALALMRGNVQRENILFALVCIWYALLAPLFISHHLLEDHDLILSLERKIHFLFVFLPLIQVLFFHDILGIQRPRLILALAIFGAIMAPLTQTDLYFSGLHHYSWGYIAKGGPAFMLFGLVCGVVLLYSLWCFRKALRATTNPVLHLKYRYMHFAFGLTAVLTIFNIPAIIGLDLYPTGNFGFIPLSILAYGLLKHRLLDGRGMVHLTLLWGLTSSLILVPNLLLWRFGGPWLNTLPSGSQFPLLMLWVVLNYIYLRRIQPWIDRRFNHTRYHLRRAKWNLFDCFQVLRNSEAVVAEVIHQVGQHLHLSGVRLIQHEGEPSATGGPDCDPLTGMADYLEVHTVFLDRPLVQTHPMYADDRDGILKLMDALGAEFLQPLVSHGELLAVLVIQAQPGGRRLNPHEVDFLEKVAHTAAVALSNAIMYERITDLKDDLEEAQVAMERALIQANEMTSKAEVSNYVLAKEVEERKRAEEALRASEEQYRLIAENTSDIIWTMDMNTRFTYISPSVEQMRGITVEKAMEQHITEVLTPDSLDQVVNLLGNALSLEKAGQLQPNASQNMEVEMYRHDGTTFWAEITMSFIRDGGGKASGMLGITRDITKRKAAEQNLVFLAYHDALTGLANRKAFIEKLETEVAYARRYQSSLVVMLLDLDGFKAVNDTHGHEAGDHLLVAVGQRLTDTLRETDFIARLGGDEFIIILANPENKDPSRVALRIQQALSKPYKIDDLVIDKIGASIGIAQFPGDGKNTTSLIHSADTAMYQAKKAKCGFAFHATLSRPAAVAIGQ
jgi:diguanylate cyclase (GGDEF)-like protein/PAS domain S-box-containing protein